MIACSSKTKNRKNRTTKKGNRIFNKKNRVFNKWFGRGISILLLTAGISLSSGRAYAKPSKDSIKKEITKIGEVIPTQDTYAKNEKILFNPRPTVPINSMDRITKRLFENVKVSEQNIKPITMREMDIKLAIENAKRFQVPPSRLDIQTNGKYTFGGIRLLGTKFVLGFDSFGVYGIFKGPSIPGVAKTCPGKMAIEEGAHIHNINQIYSNSNDSYVKNMFPLISISLSKGGISSPVLNQFKNKTGCKEEMSINWNRAVWSVRDSLYGNHSKLPDVYRFFYRSAITGKKRLLLISVHNDGSMFAVGFETDSKPSLVHFIAPRPEEFSKGPYKVGIVNNKDDKGNEVFSILLIPSKGNAIISNVSPATGKAIDTVLNIERE